jgi:hypothetical protein
VFFLKHDNQIAVDSGIHSVSRRGPGVTPPACDYKAGSLIAVYVQVSSQSTLGDPGPYPTFAVGLQPPSWWRL